MKDFKLDGNGDLMLAVNDVATTDNDNEIIQRVATTLKTRLGEFEPDLDTGLDNTNLFGKQVNAEFLEQDIRDAIDEQVSDVVEINSIEIGTPDNHRDLPINLALTTISDAQINSEIVVGIDGGEN